jgi:hypothetical protein
VFLRSITAGSMYEVARYPSGPCCLAAASMIEPLTRMRQKREMGLIACRYRAPERRQEEIEFAAHELLQLLDVRTA